MTNLEQSMADFVKVNGLCHFAVSFSEYHDEGWTGRYFECSAQWLEPLAPHGRGIASGNADTIAEAMTAMTAEMVAKRGANVIADEALPECAT